MAENLAEDQEHTLSIDEALEAYVADDKLPNDLTIKSYEDLKRIRVVDPAPGFLYYRVPYYPLLLKILSEADSFTISRVAKSDTYLFTIPYGGKNFFAFLVCRQCVAKHASGIKGKPIRIPEGEVAIKDFDSMSNPYNQSVEVRDLHPYKWGDLETEKALTFRNGILLLLHSARYAYRESALTGSDFQNTTTFGFLVPWGGNKTKLEQKGFVRMNFHGANLSIFIPETRNALAGIWVEYREYLQSLNQPTNSVGSFAEDAIKGLHALGYKKAESRHAVEEALTNVSSDKPEQLIKEALQYLAKTNASK